MTRREQDRMGHHFLTHFIRSTILSLDKKIIQLIVVGCFGIPLLLIMVPGFYGQSFSQPPEQPIAFPHTIHAGTLGLPCTFCHIHVDKSKRAGVPSVEKCMYCHTKIATDRPEIQKLTDYYENKKPIHWNRIHTLPDFVYFSHKRHIKKGLDCSECHGDVASMEVVRKVSSLKMGWCVTCHRAKGAPMDCAICHQ
jgi:hypothetical protein